MPGIANLFHVAVKTNNLDDTGVTFEETMPA